jgi:prepilin peptidase CpaA
VTQPIYIAVVVVALACATDLRSRRIPNVLTLTSALAAIACAALFDGYASAGTSAVGWLVGIALFFPFFALGGLGAGDVKLLGAVGAWVGPSLVIRVSLYSAIAGGIFALMLALKTGYLRTALLNIRFLVTFWIRTGFKPVEGLTLASDRAPRLAYAFPMLAGLLVTLWLR